MKIIIVEKSNNLAAILIALSLVVTMKLLLPTTSLFFNNNHWICKSNLQSFQLKTPDCVDKTKFYKLPVSFCVDSGNIPVSAHLGRTLTR